MPVGTNCANFKSRTTRQKTDMPGRTLKRNVGSAASAKCGADEVLSVDARVKAVIGLMNNSPGGQGSTRGLGTQVNLAPVRLRHPFKKETGRSPMQYLRDLRMQHARDLLRGTFLRKNTTCSASTLDGTTNMMKEMPATTKVVPTVGLPLTRQALREFGHQKLSQDRGSLHS
jgi:AraC-like DNA-binding protein